MKNRLVIFLVSGLQVIHITIAKVKCPAEVICPALEDVFFAVSPFAAAKSRYVELKRSERAPCDCKNEDSECSVKICEVFTRSPFVFDNYDLLPLKKNESSSEHQAAENASSEVVTKYELREVVVNELPNTEFREHVFPCPAWNRNKEEIVNFYMTNDYGHGNESWRFVFAEQEPGGKLVATAFVEKIPDVPPMLERENIEDIRARMSALLEPSYAICNLSAVAKERLCTMLSSSKVIRYPLPKSLRSSDHRQEPQCKKLNINYYPWRFGIVFEEWAIECQVIAMTELGTTYGEIFKLYISMGIEPRQVFLSRAPIKYRDKVQIFDYCFLDLDIS